MIPIFLKPILTTSRQSRKMSNTEHPQPHHASHKKDTDSYKSYIKKVQKNVHPDMHTSDPALLVVNDLATHVFTTIKDEAIKLTRMKGDKTVNSKALECAVKLSMAPLLAKHAIEKAHAAVELFKTSTEEQQEGERHTHAEKAGLTFPVGRVRRHLKENLSERTTLDAPVFLAAVMEYVIADLLDLACKNATSRKRKTVDPRSVHESIRNDKDLARLFANAAILPHLLSKKHKKKAKAPSANASPEAQEEEEEVQVEAPQKKRKAGGKKKGKADASPPPKKTRAQTKAARK